MNGNTAIDLQSFCNSMSEIFTFCVDLNLRVISDPDGKRFAAAFLDGISDRGLISSSVILPLTNKPSPLPFPSRAVNAEIAECTDPEAAAREMLYGKVAVFSENEGKIYVADCRSEDFRGVENAGVEEVVRGPHDSFIEDAKTNLALMRMRLRTPDLKATELRVGKTSNTRVYIVYLQSRAEASTVEELKRRIEGCELENLHDSGTLEMAILDGRFTVFPLIANTERPDKACAKLSEGRVAVIVDGSPVVLTAPNLYIETLQSADDYSKSPQYASFARLLRFFTVLCSLLLPAVYLSLLEYHQDMLPKKLLLTLASERSSVPYGVFTELLVMLAVFDIIREVGQRMPRAMGSVVSIVAGIVLGDAAMSSGLVGAPTLIAVAFSATCAYVSPPVTWTNILLKYVFVFLAQIGGLMGAGLSFMVLITYLCSKLSFGVPYLSPMAPIVPSGIKDTLIKLKGGVQKK